MRWYQNLKQQKLLSLSLLVFTLSVGILIGTLVSGSVTNQSGGTVSSSYFGIFASGPGISTVVNAGVKDQHEKTVSS